MNKAYERINWQNKPSTATPLSATNMNKMDLALDTIDDRVIDLDTNKADKSIVKVGNPITFNTADGGVFDKAEVEFSPIQDLHGYDNPWVGGAGKNKLPLTVAKIKSLNSTSTWDDNTTVVGGVEFAILTENNNVVGIKVKKVSDIASTVMLRLNNDLSAINGISVILNGCPTSITGGVLQFYLYDGTNVANDNGEGSSVITTNINSSSVIRLIIYSNFTGEYIFRPMVRLSTISDPTFEPYENICPITGYTALNIFQSNGSTTTPDDTYTQSLGSTYYGGTYDFATGKLTIKYVKATSLSRGSLDSSGKLYLISYSGGNIKSWDASNLKSPYIKCSHLDSDSLQNARQTLNKCIVQFVNGIYIGGYVGEETALDNLLASNDFSIIFELATPTEVTLTPTQISALVGDNVMWTDGDKVTVRISTLIDSEYVTYDNTSSGLTATNVQDAIDELKALISALGN